MNYCGMFRTNYFQVNNEKEFRDWVALLVDCKVEVDNGEHIC